MIEEVGASGQNRFEGVSRKQPARQGPAPESGPELRSDESPGTEVSLGLRELVSRVSQSQRFRSERVQQVAEQVRRGTLVSPKSLRGAAEKILMEGP